MSTTLEGDLEDAAATVHVPIGDLDAVVRRARQRIGRRRRIATTIMAFCVAGVAVAGVRLAGSRSSSTAEEPQPQVSVSFDPKRPTRTGLLDLYDDPRPGFPRVDRVEVKKTTWGDVRTALEQVHHDEPPATIGDDAEVVYVVVQAGLHLPAHDGHGGAGEEYTWGAMVFAAEDGRPVASFARPDGQTWPLFFVLLADLPGD
jgi:hypothetical protein